MIQPLLLDIWELPFMNDEPKVLYYQWFRNNVHRKTKNWESKQMWTIILRCFFNAVYVF